MLNAMIITKEEQHKHRHFKARQYVISTIYCSTIRLSVTWHSATWFSTSNSINIHREPFCLFQATECHGSASEDDS
jgi:hypothetical protein